MRELGNERIRKLENQKMRELGNQKISRLVNGGGEKRKISEVS